MPETISLALDVAELSKYLEGLPDVLSTAANLSSYRSHLHPLATATSSWLGMVPDAINEPHAGFYPLAHVGSWDAPGPEKTGRLYSILFLKGARFIYDHVLTNRSLRAPQLVLGVPEPLPVPNCPGVTDANDACGACPSWMHCAAGALSFGRLWPIRIKDFHYRKVCETQDGWRTPGESVARISFHSILSSVDHGFPLTSTRARALPQFDAYYSRQEV